MQIVQAIALGAKSWTAVGPRARRCLISEHAP